MQYGWSDGSQSAELGEIVPWKGIVRAQPSPIASAPAGLVKLRGVVNTIDNHALVAPLSGAPCVWWRVIVDSKRGSTSDRLLDVSEACDFHLDDGSGAVARVMRSETRVALAPQSANPNHLDAVLRLFAARNIQLSSTESLIWVEERIELRMRVSVMGEARLVQSPHPSGPHRQPSASERMVVTGPAGGTLFINVGSDADLKSYIRQGVLLYVGLIVLLVVFLAVGVAVFFLH